MSNTTPPGKSESAGSGPCTRSVPRGRTAGAGVSKTKAARSTTAGPWYHEGLKFACQWPTCRACCQGDEGYIWVNTEEVDAIAASLGMTATDFMRRHTTIVMGRRTLIERENGDCTLLGPNGCTVYDLRPGQCRSYPFWPEIIESHKAWKRERQYCPGIDEGEHHDVETIEARSRLKPRSPWADDPAVEPIDDGHSSEADG